MNRTTSRYLDKHVTPDRWPLHGAPTAACRSVVVIPALGEYPGILDTLSDLARCEQSDQTFVVVVVNNRAPELVSAQDAAANEQTLIALQMWDQRRLRVAWIDAASAGNELPAKEGVGLARKLGLDRALQMITAHHMEQKGLEQTALVCLDGDTRVDTDYLQAIHKFFSAPKRWGAVLSYAHPVLGARAEQAAILCYEFFLRYHALQLAWAGSPYGYHAIGSAMACTPQAYVAISGMNRRQAGEDFYFLQQLAKTGTVQMVPGTVVKPSGRASHRVPFGTGKRVQRFLDGETDEYRLYHPDSYNVIRRWLLLAEGHGGRDGSQLRAAAQALHPELGVFLQAQKFSQAWDRIRQQASSDNALMAQFHRWFDGLRTVQCIHHLRDSALPDAPMFEAIDVLLERLFLLPTIDIDSHLADDLTRQQALLIQLRSL